MIEDIASKILYNINNPTYGNKVLLVIYYLWLIIYSSSEAEAMYSSLDKDDVTTAFFNDTALTENVYTLFMDNNHDSMIELITIKLVSIYKSTGFINGPAQYH